ncbi:MAG: LamG domain-containing protein [Planctomycetes bacterium]|nr:LamG domain-containing protein [Planctomycetota bacterium]
MLTSDGAIAAGKTLNEIVTKTVTKMMITKYPIGGNQVITPPSHSAARASRSRRHSGRRPFGRISRGVALVSVVSVLVLLMIVATPFLLSMRDSAKRGEKFLSNERADAEAESLFERVRSVLTSGLQHIERRKLDAGAAASGGSRPANDATPTSDTPAEFQLPAEMLAEFNQMSGKEHRVWSVEIVDAQSKFNLNTCSVGVLANLLGHGELGDDITSGDDRISVGAGLPLPEKDGVVRIGSEVIKYETYDKGGVLLGCKRGFAADKGGNSGAADHKKGSSIIAEAAFQLAVRPFQARPGSWVRYTNVYEARSISDMGVTTLRAEDFDRVRRYLTAWSGNVVGDGWSNPQLVRNAISAGSQDLYAQIKNVRYFGPGTIVRITDGVNNDYAVVTDVRGTNSVALVGNIQHEYQADQTRIYTLARAAVNVNTADAQTLALVFEGLQLDGKEAKISREQAQTLAQFLKDWKNSLNPDDKNPEVGTFRSWQDFVKALEDARDVKSILNGDDFEAVLRNCLNAADARLSFSTVPICFASFDVYEARVTAALMGVQGQENARRELRRVFDVSTARSSTFVIETQADFQEQIRISRDAKWFVTYPTNVNAFYDGVNEPPSEYRAYANKNRFPDTDRAASAGHLQLREAAFRLAGRTDRTNHFDEEDSPEGVDLSKQALEISIDAPYDAKARKADLAKFVQVPQRSTDTEVGLAPFACSFWYKPGWSLDSSEHIIFDYGRDEAFLNRVSLRYDPARNGLVLAVADATREQRACEIEHLFDKDKGIKWEQDTWYHIACTVYGCSPSMMELFVDGEQVGRNPLQTRLSNQVQPLGDINSLEVEDASGFPDSGVLIVRGVDGVELFEYSQHSNTGFTIIRRKARTLDHQLDQNQEKQRAHAAGEVVELYGFAAPLLSDVKRGGGTLPTAIGPWRVFRVHGTDTISYTLTAGGTFNVTNGVAFNPNATSSTPTTVTLTEWVNGDPTDTNTLDDLGPQNSEGIALIVSPTITVNGVSGNQGVVTTLGGVTNSDVIGGVDVVHYKVTTTGSGGLTVELTNRGLNLKHWQASDYIRNAEGRSGIGRFFPGYDYGNPASVWPPYTVNGVSLPDRGVPCAFIPIGVLLNGTGSSYLDPANQEPQLGYTDAQGNYAPSAAFVQVDSEWFKYDAFDNQLIPGKTALYRDLSLWLSPQPSATQGASTPSIQSVFRAGATQLVGPIVQNSTGQGGGSGGASTNTEPSFASDRNVETRQLDVPKTSGTQPNNEKSPPEVAGVLDLSMLNISRSVDYRSWEDRTNNRIHRIANTIADSHAANAPVIPCFALYSGNEWDVTEMGRRANGGFNDLITLRDQRGSDEQIRLQWGYLDRSRTGLGAQVPSVNWVAPTQQTIQTWQWDRPTDVNDMRRYPSQAFTRAIKFPSGEMPDQILTANVEKVRFGARYDNAGGTTPAIVDELTFPLLQVPPDDRRDWVFLGQVPAQIFTAPTTSTTTTTTALKFVGIDEKTDSIPIFMPFYDPNIRGIVQQGLPIPAEVFRADGGIVRIDEELILYSSIDTEAGTLQGCVRGRFGTPAKSHEYGAIIIPVETFPTSILMAGVDESSASYEISDPSDFPDDGCLRIGDGLELIGYTEISGNQLTGPLGRIDSNAAGTQVKPGQEDKRVGGALFRGRFGTTPAGYQQGDVVLAMPWRHYDRYAERSDDPENAYSQFSWTKSNAIWKRVTWDENPVKNVEVIALVRFSGGPAWDADKIIRVGQEEIPKSNRNAFLYEITDPKAENLLNVEADRIEVRLMVRFAKGAYDRNMTPRPNEWKQTPWVQKVVVEYVAPSSVMSQE